MTKTCAICKQTKNLDEFHKGKVTKEGRQPYCKICSRNELRKYRHKNREKFNEQRREYAKNNRKIFSDSYLKWSKTENGRAVIDRLSWKYRHVTRVKQVKAADRLNSAVKGGKISKESCVVCGVEKVQGHHYKGYEEENWLKVIWLCVDHHRETHRDLKKLEIISNECEHEPQLKTVEEEGHRFQVNGDVCIKCQQLL